jgi:hypothetical protein
MIHPQPEPEAGSNKNLTQGVEALGFVDPDKTTLSAVAPRLDEVNRAVEVAVNGKFGLVAIGLAK